MPWEGDLSDHALVTSELAALLQQRNGFYAFESALHVFPSQSKANSEQRKSLQWWNAAETWRGHFGGNASGLVFFAEDALGTQFALADRAVLRFDPETGETEPLADGIEQWAEDLMKDFSAMTAYPLAHDWQAAHGTLPPGQRLAPKEPFELGGEFEDENLYAVDAVEGMKLRGELAKQLRDLPEGTQVQFRVVE